MMCHLALLYKRQMIMLKFLLFMLFSSFTIVVSSQDNNLIQKELKPGTIISGMIVEMSSNEPICDALIIETVENDTAAYYYTHSDKDGSFSFPLIGKGHILKVYADGYEWVKIALDSTRIDIKLRKATAGMDRDGVMYMIGPISIDNMTLEGMMNQRSGSNIHVVRQEELTGNCGITGGIIQ